MDAILKQTPWDGYDFLRYLGYDRLQSYCSVKFFFHLHGTRATSPLPYILSDNKSGRIDVNCGFVPNWTIRKVFLFLIITLRAFSYYVAPCFTFSRLNVLRPGCRESSYQRTCSLRFGGSFQLIRVISSTSYIVIAPALRFCKLFVRDPSRVWLVPAAHTPGTPCRHSMLGQRDLVPLGLVKVECAKARGRKMTFWCNVIFYVLIVG